MQQKIVLLSLVFSAELQEIVFKVKKKNDATGIYKKNSTEMKNIFYLWKQ